MSTGEHPPYPGGVIFSLGEIVKTGHRFLPLLLACPYARHQEMESFSLPLWTWVLCILLLTVGCSTSDDTGGPSVGLKWPCNYCFHPLETLRALNEEARASWLEDEKPVVSEAQSRAITIHLTREGVVLDHPAPLSPQTVSSCLNSVLRKTITRTNKSSSILVEEITFADIKLGVG